MKMAFKNGQILIKDADNMQFTIIKSWNKMKWNRAEQLLSGPADMELLNKLAGLVRLPEAIEKERQRLNGIQDAVDKERMKEDPVPLYKYPVKLNMFRHQVRAANMCLLTFGLVEPPKEEEKSKQAPKQETADESMDYFLKLVNGEVEEIGDATECQKEAGNQK